MEIIRHLSHRGIDRPGDPERSAGAASATRGSARVGPHSAERPEQFWQEQRGAVWSRIAPDRHPHDRMVRRPLVLAWSALAAMVLLAGLMLDRAPVAPPRKAQVDPDHELLMAVERAVHNDGPAALDPAALLAEEMVQDLPAAHSPIRKKEPTHEN